MTIELPKGYEPEDVERRIYKLWEESGSFKADPDSKAPPYTIVIPRPTLPGRFIWAMP